MRTVWRRFLILLGLALAAAPAGRVTAASDLGPSIADDFLTTNYPAGITFDVEAIGSADITHVALRFGTTTTTTCQDAVAIRDLEITPGRDVTASYTWDFRTSGTVPPGTEVWWEWEITDADGQILRTERRTQILTDQRFTWQTVGDDQLTIYWVDGDTDVGNTLLDLAQGAADSLRADAGLSVDQPVRLTIYPDFDSMREAVLQVAEWTGGLAYSSYNAILIGIAPDQEEWARVVIPHEYTHLVTGAATDNCLSVYMPTWLNEGLSMHFEGSLSTSDDAMLADRVRAGTLPPLRELANGFSAYGDDANTSYTQSGRVVSYLLDAYGPDPMAALLAAIKAGQPIDDALRTAYGLDTDQVDAAWRASITGDAAPTQLPAMTATLAPTFTPVPTIVAWNGVPTPAIVTQPPTVAPVFLTPTQATGYNSPLEGAASLSAVLCLCICVPVLGIAILGGGLWLVVRGSRG